MQNTYNNKKKEEQRHPYLNRNKRLPLNSKWGGGSYGKMQPFPEHLQSNLGFKAPCCSCLAHVHVPALFKIHVAFKQFHVTYIVALYFYLYGLIPVGEYNYDRCWPRSQQWLEERRGYNEGIQTAVKMTED